MKIYDISQEVLGCEVFDGDPSPKAEALMRMSDGATYNLSAFSMCAHNGTHIDAPFHFFIDGSTVDTLACEHFVGYAYVCPLEGEITAEDAMRVLKAASSFGVGAEKRILIKGDGTVREDAALVFAENNILLLGCESQSVGPVDSPMAVHKALLSHGVVLLEGLRLTEVSEGVYILSALPLKIAGFDGAPCRAVLIDKGDL